MFTFVIWAIGIIILLWIARFNLALVLAIFDSSWALGVLAVLVSFAGWCVLLASIL